MRVAAAALSVAILLAGCGPQGDIYRRPLAANPSGFVAAEIAFARLAQEKGQWTAFRETSHPDAVMFVPQRVAARDWLKTQKDPAEAVKWQPHAVYVSCDGNAAATTGAWQKGPANGFFTTVWLRDPKNGETRWILDHGDTLASPRPAGEFIETRQAACTPRPADGAAGAAGAADAATGVSPDRTLRWHAAVEPDMARRVSVELWNGSAMETIIDDRVAAPKQP